MTDSARATMEPPSELAGPLPRKVKLNFGGDARFLIWAVLLFFVGGGIALAWMCDQGFQEFQHRAALRGGRVVVGTVTHPTRGFTNYTFSVAGESHLGRARESLFPSEFPHPSDAILIRFLPDNPAINHPASWEWTAYVGLENIILDTLFFAIGAFSLFYLRRYRTLARKGSVAMGVVLSCVVKDRLFHTEYEFRTPDGKPMRGHVDRKQEFEAGAAVWVLYLPQRPRTSDLYPPPIFDIVE